MGVRLEAIGGARAGGEGGGEEGALSRRPLLKPRDEVLDEVAVRIRHGSEGVPRRGTAETARADIVHDMVNSSARSWLARSARSRSEAEREQHGHGWMGCLDNLGRRVLEAS